MARIPVFLYDAFTSRRFGGNVAGVVPDAAGLTPVQMQAIARELGAPTTGFILPQRAGDVVPVRFFTRGRELALCGHVTLAVFSHLARLCGVQDGAPLRWWQETSAGRLPLTVDWTGAQPRVRMGQAPPAYRQVYVPRGDVAGLLGLSAADLHPDLPQEVAGTGLWHLMVPLRSVEAAARVKTDADTIARLCQALRVDTIGVLALTERSGAPAVHLRDFCTDSGDIEEPGSGTTAGAAGCYLTRHRAVRPDADGKVHLLVEQGEEMGRPSLVQVWLACQRGQAAAVEVGGQAVLTLQGEILL